MQISLDTSTASPNELTALIALLHSLGGRLPAVSTVRLDLTADTVKLREALRDASGNHRHLGAEDEQTGHSPSLDEDVPLPPSDDEGNDVTSLDALDTENAAASEASVPAGSIELDADGIPWDERIHASTKTQTGDGKWRKLRGVDEVLFGQVHAELQERYAGNENSSDVPPPPSDTPVENAPTDDMDVPPPPAPDASEGSDAFAEFSDLVAAVAPFNIPYVKLAELAGTVTDGLVSKFPDLRDKPDYWPDFFAAAKALA